jgi:hypothetical protein
MKGNLYFLDIDGKEELIAENITKEEANEKALEDLKKRAPNFKSYHQRCWDDAFGRFWIDVGSHLCFYIWHE